MGFGSGTGGKLVGGKCYLCVCYGAAESYLSKGGAEKVSMKTYNRTLVAVIIEFGHSRKEPSGWQGLLRVQGNKNNLIGHNIQLQMNF